MFNLNSGSVDNIQMVVKTFKWETPLDQSCDCGNFFGGCGIYDMVTGNNSILSRVKAVEQILKIESSENLNDNLTNAELQTAAEMLLYLNMCPDTIKPWLLFYKDLFQTQSPDLIILTLNRLVKTSSKTEHFGKIAETLYQRMKRLSEKTAENAVSKIGKSEGEYLIINHPVHIMTKHSQMSPSAFIPFCDFGGNMSGMGVLIDKFHLPVCDSFQATIKNDQLCYEVDLNSYSDKNNIENEIELGLTFLMDYNEDRQVTFVQNTSKRELGLTKSVASSDQNQHAFIYLDTIGNNLNHNININDFIKKHCTYIETVKLIGEGEYNLNALKEIRVTSDFLGLDQDDRKCQNEEPLSNCTTRQYHHTMLKKCGCLPVNNGLLHKVQLILIIPH